MVAQSDVAESVDDVRPRIKKRSLSGAERMPDDQSLALDVVCE
jgi:hypothetical protein